MWPLLRAVVVGVLGLSVVLGGLEASAQCVNEPGTFLNAYVVGGDNRDRPGATRVFGLWVVRFNGRPSLLGTVGNDAAAWDIASGVPGTKVSSTLHTETVYPHNEYRVAHLAVMDGFPYGFASYTSEGWATFKMVTDGSGRITSIQAESTFTFPSTPNSSQWLTGAGLFRTGGRVYVVGRWLDRATAGVKIADMGTGSSTPPMTVVSTLPYTSSSSLFDVVEGSGGPYLYQYGYTGLYIFDVSNPSNPTQVRKVGDAGFRILSVGQNETGPGRPRETALVASADRLYTVPGDGYFYIYDISNPTSPVRLARGDLSNSSAGVAIASDGQLVAVSMPKVNGGPRARYFSVIGDQISEIAGGALWDSANDVAYDEENPEDIALLPGASVYNVYRAQKIRGYRTTVSASCLNATPQAGLAVTRVSSSGTATCSTSTGHTIAAKGFPGDTFNVANQSTGIPAPTVDSVIVTGVDSTAGNTGYSQTLTNVGGVWPWASPADQWGEYEVTLSINGGTDTASKYVYLCNDPEAVVAITEKKPFGGSWQPCNGCGWLAGDSLRLSATASEGWPTPSATTWDVEHRPTAGSWGSAPTEDYVDNGNGTLDLILNNTGDYRATANVTYPFDAGTPRQAVSQDIHSGEVTATIIVTQSGNTIASGGSVLSAVDLQVAWSGEIGGGLTPTYAWSSPQAGGWSCATATCQIPAGTFPLGGTQVNLTVTTTGDLANASASFQVVELTSNFSWSPSSPVVGGTTIFSVTEWSGSHNIGRFVFPESGCDPGDDPAEMIFCAGGCGSASAIFHFRVSGSKTVILQGSNDGVNWVELKRRTVSVGSGSCPSSCTNPSAPALSSPSNGATGLSSTVTLSWSASTSGTTPITYTASVDGSARCSNISSTSCSVSSLAGGSHTWFVRASNSCGNTNSTTRSFTVGTTPPPTASGTFSASPSSTNIGQEVTFTITSVSGADQVRFRITENDCDGKIQEVACNGCGPGAYSVFRFASAGTKTAYMEGMVGGSWSILQTRTVTILNQGSCSACEAPGQTGVISPANGAIGTGSNVTLQWTAPATGTPPFTYQVWLNGDIECQIGAGQPLQCPVPGLPINNNANNWHVIAFNACSQSTSASWTFKTCGQTAAPAADFTWSPQGLAAPMKNGYQQLQPYVGQTVQFTDLSTGSPSQWEWYDFQNDPTTGIQYFTPNPTHVFSGAGPKNVRLKVWNCVGVSGPMKVVTVYADNRPVIAEFGTTPTSPSARQATTFTAGGGALYGDPTTYTWEFPDLSIATQTYGGALTSTTKTGNPVSHTFDCPGQYDVILTVARGGATNTVTQRVTVGGEPCCEAPARPVSDFTWSPMANLVMANGFVQKQPYVGQEVQFTDLSTNGPTWWNWYDFQGDVPLPGLLAQNPSYVFTSPGVRNVRLKAGNCQGANAADALKEVTVFADERPVFADFTWAPGSATTGVQTTFTARQGELYGTPETFMWALEGGPSAPGVVVPYVFECAGSYQVTLTVGARGQTDTITKTVVVGGTSCCDAPGKPVSSFTWAPQGPMPGAPAQLQPFVGQPVSFTNTSTNAPTEWYWWDFQNDPTSGISYTTQHVTHTFARAGNHNVRMWGKNCAGKSTAAALNVVTVFADVRPVVAQFTCAPTPINTGVEVTCTATTGFDVGAPTSFTFTWGDDGATSPPGPVATHTFECRGSYDVSLTVGKNGVANATQTQTLVVNGFQCCEPPGPVSGPLPAPSTWTPGGTLTLSWQPPALGTAPLTYDVLVDGLMRCTGITATQCVIYEFPESSETHRWSVIARNTCGSTDTTGALPEWTFRACSAPGVPTAAFDWEPTGPLPDFPDQQQPYVGQEVFFYDRSTNQPTSWSWYDFQGDPQGGIQYTTENATHTFSGAGNKNVRLKVSNCSGTPRGVLHIVTVYEDVRPVMAEFDYLPEQPASLKPVTFVADDSDSSGNPNQFTWIFDDGTPPQDGREVTHVFACGRSYKVTLTAKRVRGKTTRSATVTRDIQVIANGRPCSPESLLLIDLTAKIPPQGVAGDGGDLTLYNASREDMLLDLMVRPIETGEVGILPLPPLPTSGSFTLQDLLLGSELGSDAATVWISRADGGTALPVVSARNYSQTATGETYSQFLPIFQVWPGSSQDTTQWFTGLIHNGTNVPDGFWCYLTIVNPMGTPWSRNVGITMYSLGGERIGSTGVWLPAYGYKSLLLPYYVGINNSVNLGPVTVKIDVPADHVAVVTASMVHTTSATSIVIPSQTAP